jgi:DNA-binding response OmpR family regulator
VKELAEFMKGKANIKSTVQQGTLVTVTIPLASCFIADAAEFELRIPKAGLDEIKPFIIADEQNEDRNTVLIVEDNDELRDFIADLLKADYNLILAVNGREGAKAAFKYLPDIIVSDVMMPDMNGFDMCALLKKDERTSHIPVILLTAKDGSQSSLEGYQTGADDYIIKPFDNELLKLKIRNIIATSEASRRQFDLKSMLSFDSYKFGNTDKEFMKKCLATIEKNIDNSDFSVELLAGEMSFSNRNFYRKIRALTNQTPAELVRIYRLHYAKQLLQNTDMKVFEIAMAIGYEDVNRFRQAYKKLFGFPPSESINNVVA